MNIYDINMSKYQRLYQARDVVEEYAKSMIPYPNIIPQTIVEYLVHLNHDIKEEGQSHIFDLMLDAGCGSGDSVKLFTPYFRSIIGFDISQEQVRKAKENLGPANIDYLVRQAESMPAEDKSVDLITCAFSVHFMDLHKFVNECKRVLKDTGCAVLYGYDYSDLKICNNGNSVSGIDILLTYITRPMQEYLVKTDNPEKHCLDRYESVFHTVVGLKKKRKDDLEFKARLTLQDFRNFCLAIPGYKEFIEHSSIDGHTALDKFVEEVKKLWKVSDSDDRDVLVQLTNSIYMIFLSKER